MDAELGGSSADRPVSGNEQSGSQFHPVIHATQSLMFYFCAYDAQNTILRATVQHLIFNQQDKTLPAVGDMLDHGEHE